MGRNSIMKFNLNRTLLYLLAWMAAVALALMFAAASPNEASVLGHLPAHFSRTLLHRPLALPGELPSERTLALVTFQRAHRA